MSRITLELQKSPSVYFYYLHNDSQDVLYTANLESLWQFWQEIVTFPLDFCLATSPGAAVIILTHTAL